MSLTASTKRDIQKLQRAIVDGLEDVKAQDIRVFNTEHLSPLFERVMVASGTSNRQTRALASSVIDSVRDAGFPKPRIEGEDNGEWIIVDCGPAVVHIMQPAIRDYYHLEEIWGDKPVRLKRHGAGSPVPSARSSSGVASAKKAKEVRASSQAQPTAKKPAATSAPNTMAKASAPAAKRAPARAGTAKAPAAKPAGARRAGTSSGATRAAAPARSRPATTSTPAGKRPRPA